MCITIVCGTTTPRTACTFTLYQTLCDMPWTDQKHLVCTDADTTSPMYLGHCTCQNPIFSAHVGNCIWGQTWLSCLGCSCALTWQLHSMIAWCSLQPRTPDCHGVRHGRCGVAPRTPAQLCSRRGLSPPEQCSTGNRTNDL